MKIPIRYALYFPKRKDVKFLKSFDFKKYSCFNFYYPDLEKFRCLDLAIYAAKVKKSMPCFLNAANEILVKRFLNAEIKWIDISKKLEKLISSHKAQDVLSLNDIIEIGPSVRVVLPTYDLISVYSICPTT